LLRRKKFWLATLVLALLGIFPVPSSALAGLGKKQARKLIAGLGGAKLPTSAVRVKTITETSVGAEATIEVETAFRLVQDDEGRWQVVEIRTGPDQWEEIGLLAAAANRQLPKTDCEFPELGVPIATEKVSRCLIARLLGIRLPSDSVRIRSLSGFGLPFASNPSTLAVALVTFQARFEKERGSWRVLELRAGDTEWLKVDRTLAAFEAEKRRRAHRDLETIARALEAFRRDNGSYVMTDKHRVLIDHLSPRFLAPIIRLDPWHNPYAYQGERDRFWLRSHGPDGKENTRDDVVLSRL